MTESEDPSSLPEDIEKRLYSIAFDLAGDEQARELDALLDANPTHAPVIEDMARRLVCGEVLAGALESEAIEAEVEPRTPEAIGPYRIVRPLGEGGFGVVYLAERDEPVKQQVAIKLLRGDRASRAVLSRFEAERQALAMMNHDNIARFYGAMATPDGQPYFVMEFVEGIPITVFCDRERLSLERRLQLFRSACDGVQHAHGKGIIHRDLKPSNLLVTTAGRPVPKIIDFGLARATGFRLTDKTIVSMEGSRMGTLGYMSPEQAELGPAGVDTRSDIYSLGVMLYELLTGTLPIPARSLFDAGELEAVRMIKQDDPPPPSRRLSSLDDAADVAGLRETSSTDLRTQLRGDLDWIVMRCLEKEPARRYTTVAELSEDIARHLEHQPVLARPPSTGYLVRKFYRRHRGPIVAVASLLAAILVGLFTSTYYYIRAARSNDEFQSVAAIVRLREVFDAQRDLFPPWPRSIPNLQAWLDERASPVLATEARAKATVAALRGRSANRAELFLLENLTAFLNDVGKFREETVPDVRARLEWARTVEKLTIADPRDAWQRAQSELAADSRFRGLSLPPQIGLVPLGADPSTGLQEFWHARSGTRPQRDPESGRLRFGEETGIVFVLLPGGAYRPGAAAEQDPLARSDEKPPEKPIELAPFFLAKTELTQGQWLRLAGGENPAYWRPGNADGATLVHPVENVGWVACHELARHFGLELPSEVQWEYACRGGSSEPWPWPRGETKRYANLADRSLTKDDPGREVEDWNDGSPWSAPVAYYEPNGFGFYDMLGNVWEWCWDGPGYYDAPDAEPGTGRRPDAPNQKWRPTRGASYQQKTDKARCTRRRASNVNPHGVIGLRMARRVLRRDSW